MAQMLGKHGVLPQDKQDAFNAEKARVIAKINSGMAIANAVKVQDEATREKTEEIKRATPGYGYFKGGKKSRRA